MASNTIILSVRIDPQVMRDIDNLAGAAGLDRSEYVKLWLGAIRRLKREHAVTAIGDIRDDRLKGLPGRPREDGEDGNPTGS